jgi:hypothetical protein
VSDTDTDSESDDHEIACTFEQGVKGTMPTKFMSKSERRHVRRNLYEIGEAYAADANKDKVIYVTKVPKQIHDEPRQRKPGPWRLAVMFFTWTDIRTVVAGTLPNWRRGNR